jgi:ABC-type microcin C transport system duplicated ATPase subunit YejF
MTGAALTLKNVAVRFHTLDGVVDAVKGVSLSVNPGETLAIVGESGSGKSQLMMAVMGLLASNGQASGEAAFDGKNLIGMPKAELNAIRVAGGSP